MEVRRLNCGPIEIRSKEEGGRTVAGYVVKWDQRSELIWGEFYEKVAKGAFTRSLQDNTIKALWNHDTNLVLGSSHNRTLRLTEDDVGLAFELDLPQNTWGNDALESISRGDVDGVSFGFGVRDNGARWEYLRDLDLYERTLFDVDLWEISPTPFPAYPDSQVDKRSMVGILESGHFKTKEQRKLEKEQLLIELDLLKL